MYKQIVLLLVGALLWPLDALAKPPAGIEMEVQVGYDGIVQQGRINPIMVDVDNASPNTQLKGELVLKYNGVEYTTPLDVPSPSSKRFFLYFPCDSFAPYLTLQVRSKEWTESIDINPFFKTAKPADTSILVLSSQSGSLGVVNQLDTVRLNRDIYTAATSAIESSKTFVSYYSLEDADANPKFFARADVIVLADIDYEQVSERLAEAIKASVAGGTGLVFSLGLNGAALAGSPLAEVCPLATERTVQLADLGEFGARYGLSAGGTQATYAVGRLLPGAEVLARSGDVPAVVRWNWGSGSVTALAFDFTARPFRQRPELASLFLDTALAVHNNVEVRSWFIHPEAASKILKGLAEARPMPPYFVLLFLLAYVALVGPANFLLLRVLKRQTLVWTTIPLIIAGFSMAGMETGRLTRGADNVVAAFQELHVYPRASYLPYQTEMLVFTAERTRYALEVPDESAFLYASIPQQLDEYAMRAGPNPAAFRGLTESKIDNSLMPLVTTTQGKWTSKHYFYQGYSRINCKVEAKLSAVRLRNGLTQPTGSFSLDLPFDLQDAYVSLGAATHQIGRLKGNGTYDIAQVIEAGRQTGASQSASSGNYLLDAHQDFAGLQRGASIVGLEYRNEILLVGFTDKVEGLAEFKREHKSHTLTMVVLHLPFEPRRSDSAPAEVRTLIAGGAGFEVESPWGYSVDAAERQLFFQHNGYLDLRLELLGKATQADRISLTLGAKLDRNSDVKRLAETIEIHAWDGKSWRQVRLQPDSAQADFSIGGLARPDNVLQLRLVSRVANLQTQLPRAEAYST